MQRCSICSILIFSLLILLTPGCRTGLGPVYSPEELRTVLKQAGGWVPLVIPDSKYRTGSIITVNPTDGQPRWIDHLDSCITQSDFSTFLEIGDIPKAEFNKATSFDAIALLNYYGISAGPAFNRIKTVTLSLNDQSAIAMRVIKFRSWYQNLKDANYLTKIDPCLDALDFPNMFLVTEAFVVNNASYKLFTETGAQIELKLPELSQLIKFAPTAKFSISSDGNLTINEPTVFAVRKALRAGAAFHTLAIPSGAEAESADGLLEKWYMKSYTK
ncbi:MAG: hypothetical protein A4E19_02315 [Nitrospira sp. SG-bin1]|nr:MAG: hypothetical protein A4E19_02315 [Nitrospira sp. SG-bin1]